MVQGLRRHGFRVTPQRAVILETIAHGKGHQSAWEVYAKAREQLPGLNLATVYRTLDTLHRVGMVDIFSTSVDNVRFSYHNPDHPHHHLACRACGEVREIQSDLTDRVARDLRRSYGFHLDAGHLTFAGLCANCARDERQVHKGG